MSRPEPSSPAPLRTAAGLLPGPAGVRVGHAHADGGGWCTGTTVVLPPPGTTGSVVVAGGAPGTRETDALAPGTLVSTVDAVVLSGGSAFGLAAADGVMAWCEEHDRGHEVQTPVGAARVPIVPAAILFDLGRGGDVRCRPDASFGRTAVAAAAAVPDADDDDPADVPPAVWAPEGPVGAGTGARVDHGLHAGGVGVSGLRVAGTTWRVGVLVAANAAGAPTDPAWRAEVAGTGDTAAQEDQGGPDGPDPSSPNTTLAVVVTDAPLDVAGCHRLAAAAQAGLARAVEPSHTLVDGDVVVALSTGAAGAASPSVAGAVRDRVALEASAAGALRAAFTRAVRPASRTVPPWRA